MAEKRGKMLKKKEEIGMMKRKLTLKSKIIAKGAKKECVRSKDWGIAERGKNHFRLGRERHLYVMVLGLIQYIQSAWYV